MCPHISMHLIVRRRVRAVLHAYWVYFNPLPAHLSCAPALVQAFAFGATRLSLWLCGWACASVRLSLCARPTVGAPKCIFTYQSVQKALPCVYFFPHIPMHFLRQVHIFQIASFVQNLNIEISTFPALRTIARIHSCLSRFCIFPLFGTFYTRQPQKCPFGMSLYILKS